MLRELTIDLEYQNEISATPISPAELYQKACGGDPHTVEYWKDTWIKNYKSAKDHFGELGDKSFGQLYGLNRHKPMIIVGSGPSLKHSIEGLRENSQLEHPLKTISCLHNFGLFEDEGIHADYYLSLDSGGVVIDDVSEARNKDGDFYWEQTKGKKLIAYASSDPRLWELWQGEIYLFNCLIPNKEIREEYKKVERFAHYMSSGGNALGACFYTAKAVMGSDEVIIVGGDFCFDYDNTFHSAHGKTKYDTPGQYVRWTDVFGNLRKTWQSYLNFKFWFDNRVQVIPGSYVNCSEGLLGAYREGNIRHYKYMNLHTALVPYKSADEVILEERSVEDQGVSKRAPLKLADLFGNSNYEHDITLF